MSAGCHARPARPTGYRPTKKAFAAGSKFKDDDVDIDENDPSKRWIARYEREADRAALDAGTRTFGAFGSNENGLQDVGGMLVVEGQHRAYMTYFVRHAKAGGCAVGVPPDNLGFRLVVECDKWPSVQHLVGSAAARQSR